MKVAYLCNQYPATTHTFIRREINGLEERGIEVERMTIRRSESALPTPEDREELERTFGILERGIPYLLANMLIVGIRRPLRMMLTMLHALRLGIRSQTGLAKHIAYLGEACVVLRHAQRKGFTHIHAHFGTNAATVAMLVRKLGGPSFSFTVHGSGEWDCPEFLHLRQKVEEAEFVIAISDFAKSQTYRWTNPACWGKVHVVRCGVDRGFTSHSVSPVPDVSRLVMIGRLGRSKGHLILLEALQRLVSEGVDFHMLFVGDGPLRAMIEHQIDERGLREYIELAGWMDNNSVREEFLSCRGMVLPSFSEGLPVVIMEALALGRPVVCTRVGGISELVVDGESGWLVNAGNVDELAMALRKMLKTPVDELSRMGIVGREAVMQKHDSLVQATKLAELLRSHRECRQGNT
jgi:glycosyltransferase involved in cell wall biosynthesis